MTGAAPLPTGRQARTMEIPLNPPFPKGEVTPPFRKWFGTLTILSSSKEGGGKGFKKAIF